MNKENIIKLAEALEEVQERDPEIFDMNDWGTDMWCSVLGNLHIHLEECGDLIMEDDEDAPEHDGRAEAAAVEIEDKIDNCMTAGCIAGWAVLVLGDGPPGAVETSEQAAILLELDDPEMANILFMPSSHDLPLYMGYRDITAGMSAQVLRTLAQDEIVDWQQLDWTPEEEEEEEEEEDGQL